MIVSPGAQFAAGPFKSDRCGIEISENAIIVRRWSCSNQTVAGLKCISCSDRSGSRSLFKSDRCGIEIGLERPCSPVWYQFKSDRCGIEIRLNSLEPGIPLGFKSDRCGIEMSYTIRLHQLKWRVQIRPLRD